MLLILAGAWVALEVLVIAGQELGIPCLGPVFLVFLNLLGQSLLGLGLLITVPVSALVVTSVYRQLGAQLWIPSPSLRASAHGGADAFSWPYHTHERGKDRRTVPTRAQNDY